MKRFSASASVSIFEGTKDTKGTKGVHCALALLLVLASVTSACAPVRWNTSFAAVPQSTGQRVDPALLAEYLAKLPPGTTVKVERVEGKSIRGTLIKATDQSVIVQARTRIPEPPIEIPLRDIVRISPEHAGNNVGKAIGIGAAAGAGAALAVFLIIIAAYAD